MNLKIYEDRHNIVFPDKPIKVLYQIDKFVYFETEFGLCKKAYNTFGKFSYNLRAAINRTEYLKKQFNSLFRNKYSYDNMIYDENTRKVNILCKIHKEEFLQDFSAHLRGQGCPKCNTEIRNKVNGENSTGWGLEDWIKISKKSKEFDSFKVYVIECWNDNERFFKIGRTFKTINKRFLGKRKIPYRFKIIKIFEETAKNAYNLELLLKKLNKQSKYSPLLHFNGWKECYSEIKYLND